MDLRFSRKFSLLQQEGHLTAGSILAGFDALLKANVDGQNTGKFYTSFFQLSIGIERLSKLAIVADYMMEHNNSAPSDSQMKAFGHRIGDAYKACVAIHNKRAASKVDFPSSGSIEEQLLLFLQDYANNFRYYNLKELSAQSNSESPLSRWYKICTAIVDEEVAYASIEKIAQRVMRHLDAIGWVGYVYELDFDNQAMTTFDYCMRIERVRLAAPRLIWRIICLYLPVYDAFSDMMLEEQNRAAQQNRGTTDIPYLYEFFPFLLASRSACLRRKNWSNLF